MSQSKFNQQLSLGVELTRVVEDPDARNIGCDPPNMPTSNYIARYVPPSRLSPSLLVRPSRVSY